MRWNFNMRFHPTALQRFVGAIFAGAGSDPQEADAIAEHLVRANLVGHDSHGVIRTPQYMRYLREGNVFVNRKLAVDFENDTMASADGQLGFGQSIGKQAIDLGLRKCAHQGMAVIALRNSGHLGRIGHWAERATDAGCISLHFVNTSGLGMFVVPAGGIDRRLSVNPVAMGVPVEGGHPIILDMATAATAEGKLSVAKNRGDAIPDGWILNSAGEPTNDPNEFYSPPGGAILPMGGHKGYGLCFMMEILAGALTGNGCSREGKSVLEQAMLTVLIDPVRLPTHDTFGREVCRYVDFVKSSRPSKPGGQVLVPGEIERQNLARRLGEGIELDEATWDQIVEAAREHGIDPSLIDAATE